MAKRKEQIRCKNCGHLVAKEDGKLVHAMSNHSMYCPCKKPELFPSKPF